MMLKKNCGFIIFFIISLQFTGCGLPSYMVVDAPTVSNGSTYLGFDAPDDENIDGYEIYYKIYLATDTDSIAADKEKFDNESASYIYEFGNTKPLKLNFHRLMRSDSGDSTNDEPSVPFVNSGTVSDDKDYELDSGENFRIYIDIITYYDNGEDVEAVNGIPLRVAIDEADGYFKNFFSDKVESPDSDRNGVDSEDTEYSVSFVVYSYVNNSILLNYKSSYPVFLGTMIINILNN